jgi:hypothetical protein
MGVMSAVKAPRSFAMVSSIKNAAVKYAGLQKSDIAAGVCRKCKNENQKAKIQKQPLPAVCGNFFACGSFVRAETSGGRQYDSGETAKTDCF